MLINKKLLAIGAVAGLLLGSSLNSVNAADQDIEASINAQQAVTITPVTDMDFGDVEYESTHGGNIQLGTNGTVVLAGATGITLGAAATTAGDVDIFW